jgi:RNA polymerase sigma-70 factor (ECF subfamily)
MTADPFRDALLAQIPSLRAFAYSLLKDWSRADDMVQDTIVKAWQHRDRFEEGTNLGAWLFTILRNLIYSAHRKRAREVEDADGSYAARLRTHPDQLAHLDFQDMQEALQKIPLDQREALLLIGAEGLSYEEAAEIMGVAVGTVKSRVNRARNRLAQLMGVERQADLGPDRVILAAVQGG